MLAVQQQLEMEMNRFVKASLDLQEANLSVQERQLRDADIRRQQMLFSKVCAEASPNWREDASAAFKAKGCKQ